MVDAKGLRKGFEADEVFYWPLAMNGFVLLETEDWEGYTGGAVIGVAPKLKTGGLTSVVVFAFSTFTGAGGAPVVVSLN